MTQIDYNNPNEMWRHNDYDPYKGMSDEERIKAGCMQVVAYIVMLIVGLALCALFGSCTTTKYVPVIEHKTDTVRQCLTLRDSIWLHDSISVKEKGDTVRIERWHTKYVEKQVHDTTYVATHDTIPQPYPIETVKLVEKELNWWQRLRLWIGNVGLIALLAVIGYYGVKLWRVYKFF